jgi:hypothetical protein
MERPQGMRTLTTLLSLVLATTTLAADIDTFIAQGERIERKKRPCVCRSGQLASRMGTLAFNATSNGVLVFCNIPTFAANTGNMNGSSACYDFGALVP